MINGSSKSYLAKRITEGDIYLFTGAGVTLGAKNRSGGAVKHGGDFAKLLWEKHYPGLPFDPSTKLQDVFDVAKGRGKNNLQQLINNEYNIDKDSVKDFQVNLYNLPWKRIYTVNVDNLGNAINHLNKTNRKCHPISYNDIIQNDLSVLYEVHLNGCLTDDIDKLIFSKSDYTQRVIQENPWYGLLASELISSCFIIIGSKLDEDELWKYIELRDRIHGKEFRSKSFLVLPELNRAKQEMLSKYNFEFIQATTEEFSKYIWDTFPSEISDGITNRLAFDNRVKNQFGTLSLSSFLPTPKLNSNFLKGTVPDINDVYSGFTAKREVTDHVEKTAIATPLNSNKIIVINGTAGCGKTTVLLQSAIQLQSKAHGACHIIDCNLFDYNQEFFRNKISDGKKIFLLFDNAGQNLPKFTDFVKSITDSPNLFVVASTRSIYYNKLNSTLQSFGIAIVEIMVPPLTNTDIDGILDVLQNKGSLGKLKPLTFEERRSVLLNKCGRQLIVAMLEATTGKIFKQILEDEFESLSTIQKDVYSLASWSSKIGTFLTQPEYLSCINNWSIVEKSETMKKLLENGLLVTYGTQAELIKPRHDIIGEVICSILSTNQEYLINLLASSAFGLSYYYLNYNTQYKRQRRFVEKTINHSNIKNIFNEVNAKRFYSLIEQQYISDYHFWLQRGTLFAEFNNLEEASQFLQDAERLEPDDRFIQTEKALIIMKQALRETSHTIINESVESANKILINLIKQFGNKDPKPIHVYIHYNLKYVQENYRVIGLPLCKTIIANIEEKYIKAQKIHSGENKFKDIPAEIKHTKLTLGIP